MKMFESFANYEKLYWYKNNSELLVYEGRQHWSSRRSYPAKSSCFCLLMTNIANKKIRHTRKKKRWRRELHQTVQKVSSVHIWLCGICPAFDFLLFYFHEDIFRPGLIRWNRNCSKRNLHYNFAGEEVNLELVYNVYVNPFIDAGGKSDMPFIMKAIRKFKTNH